MMTFLQGNVFDQLPTIPPGSVDCCVTSPPYWALRSYLPKDHPLKRFELGLEKTPREYIANIVGVFQLVRDRLADHGTVWINIGDTYNAHPNQRTAAGGEGPKQLTNTGSYGIGSRNAPDLDAGQLCLIPQRLAIALQDDGWLVRSYVIWHKPAPMPCSVIGWAWRRCRVKVAADSLHRPNGPNNRDDKARAAAGRNGSFPASAQWCDCPGCKKCKKNDGYVLRKGSWRPTSSYEPVLMLAKTSDYFCDGEPVKTPGLSSGGKGFGRVLDEEGTTAAGGSTRRCTAEERERYDSGANLRDVWKINAEPLADAHYAAYPTELVRKCLLAGTSGKGYCSSCGKPWVRVIESKSVPHPSPRKAGRPEIDNQGGNQANGSCALAPEVETVGWKPSCSCPMNEPRPALVLDPFAGSGRTAITARRLGLDFIGVELNPVYVDMAERILRDDSPLFSDAKAAV